MAKRYLRGNQLDSVYRRRTDNTMAKRYQRGNQSDSVYRRRTDNTMAKQKSTKGQKTIYKTYI